MTNEVKFLQGKSASLISLENKNVQTIYVSNDASVLAAGGQVYYGQPKLYWDSDNKQLKMYGVDSAQTSTLLATVDGSTWVKDGMLEKAELVESGSTHTVEDGPYIHLVWNTDAGKDEIYISVKDLVDAYTVDDDSESYLYLNGHAFGVSGISEEIDAVTVTSVTLNEVSGTVTSTADGTAIDIEVDGDDVKIGDYTEVEYDEAFSAETVATDDTIDEAINIVENAVKTLVDKVIEDERTLVASDKALANAAGTIKEDGEIAYIKNTDANYISAATSLADADNKLDAAIKAVEDKLITAGTISGANVNSATSKVEIDGQTIDIVVDVEVPDGTVYVGKEAITVTEKTDEAATKEVALKLNNSDVDDTKGGIELTQSTDGLSAKLYWGSF